jgi:MFS family permease
MPATEAKLSAPERRFVIQARFVGFLNQWSFNSCLVANNHHFLALCRGDTGLMAVTMASVTTVQNALNTLLAPLVGGLSDSVGRVPVLALGRLGCIAGLILLPRTRTLAQRRLIDTLFMFPTGIFLAGNQSVLDAAQSDLFGSRAGLSAMINSQHALVNSQTLKPRTNAR